MKTFVRLIRRYVLTAAGIVLVLMTLSIGLLGWLSWRGAKATLWLPLAENP